MNLLANNNKPIFEQIIEYYIHFIDAGIINTDEKLPSIRDTAIELGVNPNTVARAYEFLVEKGYIYSINKKGYYVKKSQKQTLEENTAITKKIEEAFANAINSGLSINDIRELLNEYEISLKKEKLDDQNK